MADAKLVSSPSITADGGVAPPERLTSNVVSQSIKTGGLQRGAPSNGQLAGGVGEPPIHFSLLPLLDLDLGAGVSGLHVLPETSL
jgi:hypothetical protein